MTDAKNGFVLVEGGSSDPPEGLYWRSGEPDSPLVRISGLVKKLFMARNRDSGNWHVGIRWNDFAGVEHAEALPMSDLVMNGGVRAIEVLVHGGLDISPDRRAKEALIRYLTQSEPEMVGYCLLVERVGWNGDLFVTAGQTYGNSNDECVIFAGNAPDCCAVSGDLSEWQDRIAAVAVGNSRLTFAISAALAAMLLPLVSNDSGGGFHFVSGTSQGKSGMLQAAASVLGNPTDYVGLWAATSNSLEVACTARNHLVLILDEIGQIAPEMVGDAIYRIGNGKSKQRMSKDGGNRETASWQTLLLSAGEINVSQVMSQAGQKAKGGQLVRVVDIPGDAGAGMGLIERLHDYDDAALLIDGLKAAARECYGSAGAAFLSAITDPEMLATLRAHLHEQLAAAAEQFALSSDAAPEVQRIANRFAVVAVAGELATALGITGWPEGWAIDAVARCFADAITYRGGVASHDEAALLARVREWLQANAASRLPRHNIDAKGLGFVREHSGFTKYAGSVVTEYWLLTSALESVISGSGWDRNAALRVLVKEGWLLPDSPDHMTRKRQIPALGRELRVYVVAPVAVGAEGVSPEGGVK